jgi:hypothetical protein
MPLYDANPAKNTQTRASTSQCPDPSQAYDQSATIRSRFTTGARTVGQHPCDANLAGSTFRKKSVTEKRATAAGGVGTRGQTERPTSVVYGTSRPRGPVLRYSRPVGRDWEGLPEEGPKCRLT